MQKRAIAIVQNHLRGLGHYAGTVDGLPGPDTDAAIRKGLTARLAELPAGALTLPRKRQQTMMLQLICKDRGIPCEPVDGFWGPVTQDAFEALVQLLDHGTLPQPWRDDEPSDANPHLWPRDRSGQGDMTAFFGPPGAPPIKRVRVPWTLRLAWDKRQTVSQIGCHAKVADSLERVLHKVEAHYGEAELRRLRLDLFGGCFMARKKRGGTSWSTHAWAVALDWDPERNQLKWGRDRASLDHQDYDFWWHTWEAEGWVSLGRSRNYDWMHVQAARL